jgi:iron(III) transport system permease protein
MKARPSRNMGRVTQGSMFGARMRDSAIVERLPAHGRKLAPSPLVLMLSAALAGMVVPPLIFLVASSVHTTTFLGAFDEFTVEYFADLFRNTRLVGNILNTAMYSAGSALVAITLGLGLATIVERTNTPLRRYMIAGSVISLGTPHVLYTAAWLLVLGRSGPVNMVLMELSGGDRPIFDVYSMHGMILIEGFVWTPLAYLLLSAVLRSADATLEEASMLSGAGVLQTFRHITLRLCVPGILALLLLVFIRAFESFEVPALVGLPGGVDVLTTDIYERIHSKIPPDFGQAAAFSVVLLAVVVVLLHWYNTLSRHAERYQTITGKGFRPRVMDLGRWRYLAAAVLIAVAVLIIILPIGMISWAALLPYYDGFNVTSISRVTFNNFAIVARSPSFRESILDTIIVGTAVATLAAGMAALCGWLVVRRFRGAWILDQLAMLPLIIPAIVLGVAFLQVFLNTPFGLYGTLLSLVIALTVHYLPYAMRYVYTGALQIHHELEEASGVAGAANTTTFRRIVVPLLLPAIVSSWLLIFLLSVRAVSVPLLLAGPNSKVVAVTLFELWNNGQINELAAMGVAWTALMTGVSIVFYAISRRFGLSVQ